MINFYRTVAIMFLVVISFLVGTQFEINVAMEADMMFNNFRR